MTKGNVRVFAATLALIGAALLLLGSLDLALVRGWHVTLFPSSIGILLLLVAAWVLVARGVR